MKTGQSLQELAAELTRQRDSMHDYVLDTRYLKVREENRGLSIEFNAPNAHMSMPLTELCHDQVGRHFGIPAKHYDRLKENHPDLLAHTLTTLMEREPARRMVRTLDNAARAFLSDGYRPLNNYDIASATLPKLSAEACEVKSAELTHRKLYIKAIKHGMRREVVTKGFYDGGMHDKVEVFEGGVTIQNSEVGLGSIMVAPGIHTVSCTNLATFKNEGIRKFHVGRKADVDSDSWEYLTDETRAKLDEALFAQIGDLVTASLSGVVYEKLVAQMTAANKELMPQPAKTVEIAREKWGWSETEGAGVLDQLMKGGDFSKLGLSQAVTAASQNLTDYDRASDFERLGGEIIELPKRDWAEIAVAVAA